MSGGVFGECWEGSRSVGGDGERLFEGLLPFLSPEIRKSDMWCILDLVGRGIPDFDEFL